MSQIPPNTYNYSENIGCTLNKSPLTQKIDGPLPKGATVNVSRHVLAVLNDSAITQTHTSQPTVLQGDTPSDLLTFILTDAKNEKVEIERAHLQAQAPEMAAKFKDGNEFTLSMIDSGPFNAFANFCKGGFLIKNEDAYLALDFFKNFKQLFKIELLQLKGSIESHLQLALKVSNVWAIFQKAADNGLMGTMEKVLQFIGKENLRQGDEYQNFMRIPFYAEYLEVQVKDD